MSGQSAERGSVELRKINNSSHLRVLVETVSPKSTDLLTVDSGSLELEVKFHLWSSHTLL